MTTETNECREAFQKWYEETYGEPADFQYPGVAGRFVCWQAAWNRPAATAEVGTLTDEEIDRILDEAKVPELGNVPLEYDRQVARAIERALNQRMAGEVGEAEFLSKRLSRVAKLVGVKIPESFTHEQVVEAAGTILGQIATSLSANPTPSDQQAKDAARSALLACKEVCLATGAMREAEMAIDAIAALSATTKQEEV